MKDTIKMDIIITITTPQTHIYIEIYKHIYEYIYKLYSKSRDQVGWIEFNLVEAQSKVMAVPQNGADYSH